MLFLDCEFNGFGGRLISMAIVASNGDEFYEVITWEKYSNTIPWVAENVLPKLNKLSIREDEFQNRLWNFLLKHPNEAIIADSPADFKYLLERCEFMTNESPSKYRYINLEIKMHFVISDKYESEVPHNALSDARALKKWYMGSRRPPGET